MKVLTKIWKFINSKIFGYALIAAFILLFLGTCGRNSVLKEKANRTEQNLIASNDTIKSERLKNGDLRVSINGYVANEKELKVFNEDLANQVKAQTGKVVTLNNIVFHLRQDTADLRAYINYLLTKYETPHQINDSTWNVDWTLAYTYDSANYDIFIGRTQVGLRGPKSFLKDITLTHNKTSLFNRDSKMSLTWGQKYEDDKLKVFAQTSHPAFQAQLLEGTYVDYPKKRHWFTGFGIGPAANIGYDFLHNQPAIIVGVGIQYNIYQW